ncbi:MAG: hypothetical protein C5B51_20205 [Terriglobia bacterium]|nr:MAG: hypothetical protein C5B51_20205 [Terriglobia bacterium]
MAIAAKFLVWFNTTRRPAVHAALVAALSSCVDGPLQSKIQGFLTGLSCDELEFLAEFLGASILESSVPLPGSRAQLAERIAQFQRVRLCGCTRPPADQDHKMILLLEFLCQSGLQAPVPLRARRV